jgi:hypothetical protein
MRISIFLAALLMVACSPATPRKEPVSPVARIVPRPVENTSPAVPTLESPFISPRVTSREIRGIRFEGISFDARSHRLVVADQPNGPGSRFADAAAAARAFGGMAALNASFFTPVGDALGLVVSAGKSAGAWNSASSLGNGVWYADAGRKMSIVRREGLGKARAATQSELIQAGPLLVENFQSISGLEATKASARSVLLWDGGNAWWLGCASPCTLSALGSALATEGPANWKIRYALNLDGGRSSDLWIASTAQGGPLTRRTLWNRPVRNFLVVVKK